MIDDCQRILVLGHCGAGKSTLAVQLGAALGLPVVHLDRLNWLPGWRAASRFEFGMRLREAVAGERWVIVLSVGSDGFATRPLSCRTEALTHRFRRT